MDPLRLAWVGHATPFRAEMDNGLSERWGLAKDVSSHPLGTTGPWVPLPRRRGLRPPRGA